jgi:hypothetical protein
MQKKDPMDEGYNLLRVKSVQVNYRRKEGGYKTKICIQSILNPETHEDVCRYFIPHSFQLASFYVSLGQKLKHHTKKEYDSIVGTVFRGEIGSGKGKYQNLIRVMNLLPDDWEQLNLFTLSNCYFQSFDPKLTRSQSDSPKQKRAKPKRPELSLVRELYD